ncbi:hypothetical protein GBL_1668 [Geobacillus kaustophilus GBlys]|uniref:Uncharacterized protein n=1 Tax=Geobacillus kaustophilus GBlys TaxID=1337888 RepID=U2WRQ3_GEOKU|nr:hypothetical protein GBL_1668 [Geobacillus kaustophilus GBlys]
MKRANGGGKSEKSLAAGKGFFLKMLCDHVYVSLQKRPHIV